MRLQYFIALALSFSSTQLAVADDAALTLPERKLFVSVAAQSDLTSGAMGDMISLAPDLAFGVTDDLTVALVHSVATATGFWSGHSNGSLCVAGDACGKLYNNGALLAKYGLARGRVAVAALGGVIYNIDPARLGLGAGVEALYPIGKLGLHFKPTIYIGLNDRDAMVPNTEFVNLPVSVLHATTASLQLGVQTGVAAPIDGFSAAYRVPVAVMGNYGFGPGMSANLAFSFDRVAGGGDAEMNATDARSVTLTLGMVR